MNRENLKIWARSIVPGAKIGKIDNTLLDLILNEGAIEVAKDTMCLPEDKKFEAQADTGTYLLTDIASDILAIDKSGLWWYNGTTWKELRARTREYMDDKYPNWRTRASGTPEWWFREGNNITVVPAPSENLTDGFWLYYGKKPPLMTDDTQYPFGGDLELVHLTSLSHNILDFWRWKAFEVLGEHENADKAENKYYAKIPMGKAFVQQNAALLSPNGNNKTRLKGRSI